MKPDLIRIEARNRGLTRYSTGKVCRNNHVADRFVSTGRCVDCVNAKNRRHWKANPEVCRGHSRRWAKANPELANARGRRWSKANRDKETARNRKWRATNPDRSRFFTNKWHKENPGKVNALVAKRFVQKRRAGAACGEGKAIAAVFTACPPGYHVDHIVPLGSDKRPALTAEGYPICGLHVPWNLQYLLPDENIRKGERMRPEDQVTASSITKN
jgi:hypothetical protein